MDETASPSAPRPDAPAPPRPRSRGWIVEVACTLDCPPERAWRELQRPALLRWVAAPLLRFRPLEPPAFPERWLAGEHLVRLELFGLVPLGRQVIGIEILDARGPVYRLRDNGRGRLARTWDHLITLEPLPGGRTRYRDRVVVEAGILTPFVWLFAQLFYRHRQRRWRALVARGFSYPAQRS